MFEKIEEFKEELKSSFIESQDIEEDLLDEVDF